MSKSKSGLNNLNCRFPQVAPASEELRLQLPPKSDSAPATRRAGQGTPASPHLTSALPPVVPPRSECLHLPHSHLRRLPLPAAKGAFPLGEGGDKGSFLEDSAPSERGAAAEGGGGRVSKGAGSFALSITIFALGDRQVRSGPPLQPRHPPSHPGPRRNYEIQAPEDADMRRRGVHDCLGPQGAGSERNKAAATQTPGWPGDPEGPRRPAYLRSAAAWRE